MWNNNNRPLDLNQKGGPSDFDPVASSRSAPSRPSGGYDGPMVFYADPKDQADYDRRRAALREHLRRRVQEEDPQLRRHREALIRQNSAHTEFRPPPDDQIDDSPDFRTAVQSLYWLNQRVSLPSEHQTFLGPTNPESFYQVSPESGGPHEPLGLPISFPRLGKNPWPGPVPSRPMPPELAQGFRVRAKMAENREKYVALLNATECFFAGEWTIDNMESIYNGVYPCSPQAADSLTAAEFALYSLNTRRGDEEISLKQVIRVNGQVLGSDASVFWLTLEGSNDKFYEALVVCSHNRIERVLKFIRRAKYYPEIPADCHHLIGPDY